MKAQVVLFKDIPEGTLFIEANPLPNYHVFQKTGLISAKIHGSKREIGFEVLQKIIPVAEIPFGSLPTGSQFATSADAKGAGGINIPLEIFFKDSPCTAVHVDISIPKFPLQIDDDVPIINLGRIFNFKNVTVAELNI